MIFDHINYLAVLVAAVVTFVIGALWYTVLFGKPWMKAHGYTPEQLESMKQGMARTYALSFVCYLVMAFVLAVLVYWTGTSTAQDGMHLGAMCWLGFAATIGLTANLYSDKPISAYFIDAGYQLAYLLAMGAILGGWQ